jgi:hypothetical protein
VPDPNGHDKVSELSSVQQLLDCAFFSHVICLPQPGGADALATHQPGAIAGSNAGATPAYQPPGMWVDSSIPSVRADAASNFNGDLVVFARTVASFTRLLPVWTRSAEEALATFRTVQLRSEAWVLASAAALVGASRLANLAEALKCMLGTASDQAALRQLLGLIRAESQLVLAYFRQAEQRGWAIEKPTHMPPPQPQPQPQPPLPPPRTDVLPEAPTGLAPAHAPARAGVSIPPRPTASPYSRPMPPPPGLCSPSTPISTVFGSGGRGLDSGGRGSRLAVTSLPLRVVQFLLEATLDLTNLAAGHGGSHEHEAAGPASTEQWMIAVETAESAAAVVQGLLERSEQRRLSIGS